MSDDSYIFIYDLLSRVFICRMLSHILAHNLDSAIWSTHLERAIEVDFVNTQQAKFGRVICIYLHASIAPVLIAGGAEAIAVAVRAAPVLGISNVLNCLVPGVAISRPTSLVCGVTYGVGV